MGHYVCIKVKRLRRLKFKVKSCRVVICRRYYTVPSQCCQCAFFGSNAWAMATAVTRKLQTSLIPISPVSSGYTSLMKSRTTLCKVEGGSGYG